jgi:hypothetical protein
MIVKACFENEYIAVLRVEYVQKTTFELQPNQGERHLTTCSFTGDFAEDSSAETIRIEVAEVVTDEKLWPSQRYTLYPRRVPMREENNGRGIIWSFSYTLIPSRALIRASPK